MLKPADRLGCCDVDDRLEAWLDGELPADAAAAVAAHVETCARCRDEAEAASSLQRELRSLPALDTPPHVLASVQRHTQVPRRWIAVAVSAAAATVLLSIGLVIDRAHQPDPQSMEVARATAEAQYALALIAQATHKASTGVQDELLERPVLSPAIHDLLNVIPRGMLAPPAEQPSPVPRSEPGV